MHARDCSTPSLNIESDTDACRIHQTDSLPHFLTQPDIHLAIFNRGPLLYRLCPGPCLQDLLAGCFNLASEVSNQSQTLHANKGGPWSVTTSLSIVGMLAASLKSTGNQSGKTFNELALHSRDPGISPQSNGILAIVCSWQVSADCLQPLQHSNLPRTRPHLAGSPVHRACG
jgi:hypothetical protein